MASIFSHGIAAVALGKGFTGKRMPIRFWVASVVCAMLPDIDVAGFAFGINYDDMLGHCGLTHSLLFGLILSCVTVVMVFRDTRPLPRSWLVLVLYFFGVTASHGVLDAMTDGGLGVAFFAPFSKSRYLLPWRPIEVSPIGLDFIL